METKTDKQIVLERILNAPKKLVFEAFTNPKHVINWWGPNGFTTTTSHMEVKPGGAWIYIMHGPDGVDYPNKMDFIEVVKNERLYYKHGTGDENDPNFFMVTVTFEEINGKTKLTMLSEFSNAEFREMVIKEHGALEGGKQTLNKLEAYLKTISGN